MHALQRIVNDPASLKLRRDKENAAGRDDPPRLVLHQLASCERCDYL